MPPKRPSVAAAADGETRTSRVVGSVDFVRPAKPPPDDDSEGASASLVVVEGVRCSMPFTVKCRPVPGEDEEQTKARASDATDEVFGLVEEHLSSYNPSSELNVVNSLPMDTPHVMSEPLKSVVMAAKEMVKITRGTFDPSVCPILDHYERTAASAAAAGQRSAPELAERTATVAAEDGDADRVDVDTIRRQRAVVETWRTLLSRGFGSDPSDSRVSQTVKRLLELSHWSNAFSVGIYDKNDEKVRDWQHDVAAMQGRIKEREDVKIVRLHEEAKLDLNGIAKGWAVDEIAKRLPSPCYVEWGGDIKVRGTHPSGRPWTVAVPEPPALSKLRARVEAARKAGQEGPVYNLARAPHEESDVEYLAVLELKDGDAVATSGDYEKIVEKDGRLYCHILNPHLGRLLELNETTLAQAVVVCKSCMYADALATAAISREDPSQARSMLEPLRTAFREPVSDFLLYSRTGPRIIRLSVPGVEGKHYRQLRMERHNPAHVVVVGSGLAGMSAAIEAADAGATVTLLEKESKTGGNSAKATSGINGWGTDTQVRQGVADEERLFERDTHRSGKGGQTTPSLVRVLSTKSAPAIHWLKGKFDIPLTVLSQLGGHSAKRTHRAPPDEKGRPVPIGYLITKKLRDAIDDDYRGKIEIRCGQSVTKLLYNIDEDGVKTVTGALVKSEDSDSPSEILADSVVLATGGFGCCRSQDGLMKRFRPDLVGVPTTNGPFATGDGVLLGEGIGAELVDMDKVQLHPTGFIDPKNPANPTKFLAPEAIRGSGGILVNSNGERFVNELDLRSVVAAAIQKKCGPYKDGDYVGPPFAWCILSQQAQELFGKPTLGFYKDRLGLFEECADFRGAAGVIGCDESTLKSTLESYASSRILGSCPLTGKDVFPSELSLESKDLVLARVTPSIHYTMGGISINAAGEVQERIDSTVGKHRHIRGLFAAGEVTGGVHGNNRLGGNSLLECVVFGRIAGERAATVKQKEPAIFPLARIDDGKSESDWVPVVLREVRNTDKKYGINTREVRFNLHGALQDSGLDVGQFVALRGEMDGETLMGYFSPITRPGDEGVIGILCRVDAKGGPITRLLEHIRPGSVMHMCAMGGLRLKFLPDRVTFRDRTVRHIGLLAGGTGIAPMIQIIRAWGQYVRRYGSNAPVGRLSLIYAAEEESDLAYMKILHEVRDAFPDLFRFYVVLNRPPIGWTEGVGFVEPNDVRKHLVYPPTDDCLIVMCGPPVFEAAMAKTLKRLHFNEGQWFSYATDDRVSAHL